MPRFWATGCGCNVSKCNSATFINSARGRRQGQGQGQEEEETRSSYFCITLILFFPLLSSSLHPRPLPRHLVILTGSKALVRHAEPGVQFRLLVPTTTHTRSLYHESKGFRLFCCLSFRNISYTLLSKELRTHNRGFPAPVYYGGSILVVCQKGSTYVTLYALRFTYICLS